MVTFTINIPQMLAYIPYMDPMEYIYIYIYMGYNDMGYNNIIWDICLFDGIFDGI